MAQVEATTERVVAADAETVFDTLADYSGTRGKLLPEHFSEYEVREGGDGEGTLVHWRLQATSKRVRDCLLEVTEPSDGELVEKDRNSSMVTVWRVTPYACSWRVSRRSASRKATAMTAATISATAAVQVSGTFRSPRGPSRKGTNSISRRPPRRL